MRKEIRRAARGCLMRAGTSVAVLEGAESIGIKLTHVYGLTEVYGRLVCAEQPGWDDCRRSARATKTPAGGALPAAEAITVPIPKPCSPCRATARRSRVMFPAIS